MTRKIGYARVSTSDQDLSVQKAALDREGCAVIFEEKASGTKRDGREQLALALKVISRGDILVVMRLDRLGRSMRDLANIAHEIEAKGAALKVIEQAVDTSTTAGRAFFGMLSVFAQFETDVRRERQMEGIEAAKGKGAYKGRKPTARAKSDDVLALLKAGVRAADVARQLGIARRSVYRIIEDARAG